MNSATDKLIEQSKDFEATKTYLLYKSNKRAWLVTWVMTTITLLLCLSVFFLFPLKTVEPYVIRVDASGVPDIVTALKEDTLETDEAIDKYFVARYVRSREGYVYETNKQDYALVQLMSNEIVKVGYDEELDLPNSKDKVLTNQGKLVPEIISIVLGESEKNKTATIRFRAVKTMFTHNTKSSEIFVVTLSYEYHPEIDMLEGYRLDNPLGFVVTSYRKDKEI
ncbi:TPA: type IV secretion system protein [Pasteurella multocida]|nr:type IV secretion system protein [Pasteurella multocida]HDX1177501.1 type IV secretion system protein [Pasteurella multocida]